MTDREAHCCEELERCRANIVKTKGKIEFHKDMLKKLEHKEMELLERLGALKLQDLHSIISTRGYNIDDLREAMIAGDLSGIIPQNPVEKSDRQTETPVPIAENIPQQENKFNSDEEDTSSEDNKSVVLADKDNNFERKNEL